MDFVHVTAGPDDDGRRLDRIMRRYLSEQALSGLYRSIRTGLIKVDGKKRTPDFHVSSGSAISIASFLMQQEKGKNDSKSANSEQKSRQPQTESITPSAFAGNEIQHKCTLPYEIIFKNKDILVINKPYDIPVQPSEGCGKGSSLAEIVAAEYKAESHPLSLSFTPGPLHRLDRKTTGALFFSQSIEGARWFTESLRNHLIEKRYIAIVCGKMTGKQTWEDSLQKNNDTETSAKSRVNSNSSSFHTVQIVNSDNDEQNDGNSAKTAITKAVPLAYGEYDGTPVTLAEFLIGTGRTHQIRAQSSYHGFPLLGDSAYGGGKISGPQNFYLHAYEVRLPEGNPCGTPSRIEAFISTNFEKMLNLTLINWDHRLIL